MMDVAVIAASRGLLATVQVEDRMGINLPAYYLRAKFELQISRTSGDVE